MLVFNGDDSLHPTQWVHETTEAGAVVFCDKAKPSLSTDRNTSLKDVISLELFFIICLFNNDEIFGILSSITIQPQE